MSTATVAVARTLLDSILLHPTNSDITSTDRDQAIYSACSEFLARTAMVESVDETLSLTGSVSELSLATITDFRAENVKRVELMYPNLGTWSSAGSHYHELDLVQGDGSPDSLYYVCTVEHTSAAGNEPPNTSYWTRTAWKGGFPVHVTDYDAVANLLNASTGDGYDEYQKVPVDVSRPTRVGFRTQTDAQVYPTPNVAWGVRVFYTPTMPSWQHGTTSEGTVQLPIPAEYLYPIVQFGAASIVQCNDEVTGYGRANRVVFEKYLRDIRGNAGNPGGVIVTEENDCL